MGEGPRDWRRFAGEGPSKKVYWKRATREGPFGKREVAGKVALIPCEEKNNSLIFID